METNIHDYCVILAGGKGRRLWPASTEKCPKQFVDFFGTGRTQLQSTYDRFSGIVPADNILVCTGEGYEGMVREQLPGLDEGNLLAEPVQRNTAPSVAWAHARIRRRDSQARVVVTPADQLVLNEAAFAASIRRGLDFVATRDVMLAVGVRPTRPEPGYGYIQQGEPAGVEGVWRVQSFTEKPERDFARMFMESGEFYWNTGLFLANVGHLNRRLDQMLPEVLRRLERTVPGYSDEDERRFISDNYPAYPNLSIDYGVLDHRDDVCMMCCDFGWADLGTWHSVYECGHMEGADNVVVDSEVVLERSHGNVVKLPKGKLAVINGLEGFIVAEKDNVLFICPKEDSSALVRKYVSELQMRWGEKFV